MSLSRRRFAALTTAAGLSTVVPSLQASQDPAQANGLRVIAYNVFGGVGWPYQRERAKQAVTSGNMPKLLAAELQKYKPDIVTFSESPGEEFAQEVANLLSMHHTRFASPGNWAGTLLSRYEISESRNAPLSGERPKDLFTRHWGRAVIKLPGGEPLIVHSAHLFPTANAAIRLPEIRAIQESASADQAAGRSMLVMGDLNHGPDTREYELWKKGGWSDTFAKVGEGEGLTFRADIPKWRIDYVLAFGPIAKQVIESGPLFEGAFRLDIQDSEAFALSDHLPQLAAFETVAAVD